MPKSTDEMNVDELKAYIKKLEYENTSLRDEVQAVEKSPFLPQTVAKLVYRVVLRREDIVKNELKSNVNEKQGSLFEIKTKKLVSSGSYSFIKSWLKKRKIPINKVFIKSYWEHIISSED